MGQATARVLIRRVAFIQLDDIKWAIGGAVIGQGARAGGAALMAAGKAAIVTGVAAPGSAILTTTIAGCEFSMCATSTIVLGTTVATAGGVLLAGSIIYGLGSWFGWF